MNLRGHEKKKKAIRKSKISRKEPAIKILRRLPVVLDSSAPQRSLIQLGFSVRVAREDFRTLLRFGNGIKSH